MPELPLLAGVTLVDEVRLTQLSAYPDVTAGNYVARVGGCRPIHVSRT
jgi:hypothetical protein